MTRVLVTGAGGVVGKAVVEAARGRGLEVVEHGGRSDGDLCEASVAREVVKDARPDIVVNAAGATYGDDELLWRANLVLALRLVDATVEHARQARMVLLGSAAEYGIFSAGERMREDSPCRPNSVYGMSKLAAGQATLSLAPERVVVARIFNLVAPPHDPRSLLGRVEAAYLGGEAAPGGHDAVRDFVTVEFVAEAIVSLALGERFAGVLNVCTGVPTTPAAVLGRPAPDESDSWAVGDPSLLAKVTGLDPRQGLPNPT